MKTQQTPKAVPSGQNNSHTLTLNDGNTIPQLGFGTWQLKGDSLHKALIHAFELGVRHIDTAMIYDNEEVIGKTIKASGLDRQELFITSKVWNSDHGYDATIKACQKSLQRLNTDYIDLYVIHWPATDRINETYRGLLQLQRDGLVRSIGVSNFMVNHLNSLLESTDITPAINQIELHPFNYQQRRDVVQYCQENQIIIESYSPLAQGKEFDNIALLEIADQYNKSQAQILIRWALQQKFVVIPRSSKKNHITDNYNVFDFQLSTETLHKLDSLNKNLTTTMNPDNM